MYFVHTCKFVGVSSMTFTVGVQISFLLNVLNALTNADVGCTYVREY